MVRGLAVFALALAACRSAAVAPSDVEATSQRGVELQRIAPEGERLAQLEAELAAARERWGREGSEQAAVWVGRRLAYLGRYRASIDWYTRRLLDFPDSFRLRRHRGHRFISVRALEAATADLAEAWALCAHLPDEVEPDGAPNRYGIPRGTTQTSILYHLALAAYLRGEFSEAARVWRECLARCPNDDMRVATLNWLVHALRRDGREAQARAALEGVGREMAVIENFAYHRILLLQRGWLSTDDLLAEGEDGVQNATAAYGLANWSLCNGNEQGALALMERIVASTPWNAFGHMAAEADLARRPR